VAGGLQGRELNLDQSKLFLKRLNLNQFRSGRGGRRGGGWFGCCHGLRSGCRSGHGRRGCNRFGGRGGASGQGEDLAGKDQIGIADFVFVKVENIPPPVAVP
jgi:hypothetical protein